MKAPTTTASSQFVRSSRFSHLGVSLLGASGRRRRRARAALRTAISPTAISAHDAAREGVVWCELKSWPCPTVTTRAAMTAIARSQPSTNAMPRAPRGHRQQDDHRHDGNRAADGNCQAESEDRREQRLHSSHTLARWYRLFRCADLRVRLHGVRVALRGARPRRGAGRLPRLRRDERLAPVLLLRRARRHEGGNRWWRRRLLRRLLRLRPLGRGPGGRRRRAADARCARAAPGRARRARRPEAAGGGRGDRDRAGARRPLRELRVPRREERAGPARGADPGAPPPAPARDDRRRGRRPRRAASSRVGSRVELERDDGERLELEITSVGGVSPDSPVGRALLGKTPGDEIEVDAPRGRWRARVVSVGRAS